MDDPADVDITESAWRRGWNDSKRGWTKWYFVLADMIAVPSLAFFVSPGIAVGAAALSLFAVWVGATASAPLRQRNEARQALSQQLHPKGDLAVTWPSHGISIPLHGQGGFNIKTSATSPAAVQLIYSGQGTIDIRKVIVLARITYGQVTSWNAIQQLSAEEKGGASPLMAAFSGQPMELRWLPEDGGHIRQLEGLPVTIRAGDPLQLPQLWLRVGDKDRAIELFEEWGNQATWLWSLTLHTDKGRYTFDIATPIVMQSSPEEE